MIKDAMRAVSEFHDKYGLPIRRVSADDIDVRVTAIYEESNEAIEALHALQAAMDVQATHRLMNLESADPRVIKHLRADVAKELADVIYTAISAAVAQGLDLDTAFTLVHESNMTKTGNIVNGKLTKGAAYKKPDLSACV